MHEKMTESGPSGGATRPQQAGDEAGGNQCSVCGKRFASAKALFGHMRSHPDRGWKGAHPPPRFRAKEEFVDLVNRPELAAVVAKAAVVSSAQAAFDQVHGAGDVGAQGEAKEEAQSSATIGKDLQGEAPDVKEDDQDQDQEEAAIHDPHVYRLPDLNNSPPTDTDD